MKKGFLVGLLLFGIFFGAGNLIFPPSVGAQAGEHFIPALLGFVLSGVGLAVITLIIGTLNEKGYVGEFSQKVSPLFALIILVALYLAIGPFFAIPRTAAVAYEIGVAPFSNTPTTLVIYTLLYFGVATFLALNESKILDRVGKILTPIFALMLCALIVLGFFKYGNLPSSIATESYQTQAFGNGFIEGYGTLDALASVAFCVVALNAFKQLGFSSKREYLVTTWLVGLFTAIGFSVLYAGLAFLGNKMPIPENLNVEIGAYVLTQASQDLFGLYGSWFLGGAVILTCLTTTVGLLVATSDYFHSIYNKLSYKQFVYLFSIIGFLIANIGLSSIIKISIPVLLILYPIIVSLVLLTIINKFVALSTYGMKLTVAVTVLISVVSVVADRLKIDSLSNLVSLLPLSEQSMPWLVPALLGIAVALVLPNKVKGEPFDFESLFSTSK